ncbi:MAG TPA: DUF6298 domain-containing protein [Thermoanaerobaculia bacterium]|nr:DUF6298 domain-containing protein [Thermoanaerobaculia bacterium]
MLTVHPENPRYFQDSAGRTVYLTGSHHWDVLVDNAERPGGFDFEGYLGRLESWGHNFFRLWTHEAWTHEVRPLPYPRTGPGRALDGSLRYDLTRFDPTYFERLRSRVTRAGERGFYVAAMLFNGWSIHDNGEGNPWFRHPFNRVNNVNGIDGDPDGTGEGLDVHTLRVSAITRLQEAYVHKVVETVGDLDHVLWEISNESPGESRDWQYHLIRHLKTLSPAPVGMTSCFPRGRNEDLFNSPADWISPNHRGGYKRSPPPADGKKIVLLDTDHLWGIGGGADWVWKSFLAGHHPIYMDPLDDDPEREQARRAMGVTLSLARRFDLAGMIPAGPRGRVVYLPRAPRRIDPSAELIDPISGESLSAPGRKSPIVLAIKS